MSKDDTKRLNRRNVLKGMAVGGATVPFATNINASPTDTPTARNDEYQQALQGKKVFRETPAVEAVPQESEQVNDIHSADVAILKPDTGHSRGDLVSAINSETVVSFVGRNYGDTLPGILGISGDQPLSEKREKIADVDYGFGFAQSMNKPVDLTVATPSKEHGTIGMHYYTTSNLTDSLVHSKIGKSMSHKAGMRGQTR